MKFCFDDERCLCLLRKQHVFLNEIRFELRVVKLCFFKRINVDKSIIFRFFHQNHFRTCICEFVSTSSYCLLNFLFIA